MYQIERGWKELFFLVVNRFLFYDNISEIVNNKTINCPRHDLSRFLFQVS